MNSPTNPSAPRIGAQIAALIAICGLIAACDVFAAQRPQMTLEIRTLPSDVVGFDPRAIGAPAATRVAVGFENVSTLEHNLVFLAPVGSRTKEIVIPGERVILEFTTPGAGSYAFVCTIHEEMRGTLSVR